MPRERDTSGSGQMHDVIPFANVFVEELQQIADDQVGAQGHVEHFLRIGSPSVADQVVAGKADDQQIRDVALAKLLLFDATASQIEKHLIAEGRVAERRIVFGTDLRRRAHRMRENPPLIRALVLTDDIVRPGILFVIE
jgi:hypothetical protein